MYSQRQLQKIVIRNRKIKDRQHSQSVIPSKQQSQNRQQALIKIHKHSQRVRRLSLENVVKDNYRLYININNQQSSYKSLFMDKHKNRRKNSVVCDKDKISKQIRIQSNKIENFQLNKVSKWIENLKPTLKQYKKRYCFRPILGENNHFSQNSNNITNIDDKM